MNEENMSWELPDLSSAAVRGEAVAVSHDFTTHRDAWRDAIISCINDEKSKCNHDQAAYWEHELVAYDRAFASLIDAPVSPRAADAPSETSESATPPAGLDTREQMIWLMGRNSFEGSVTATRLDVLSLVHSLMHNAYTAGMEGDEIDTSYVARIENGLRGMESRAADALSETSELRAALIAVREALQHTNDTDNGGIVDTLWMLNGPETVFDFIDTVLESRAVDALDSQPTDHPLMRNAFTTAESGPDGYFVKFKFPTMEAMQAAHMEWHVGSSQPAASASQTSIGDDARTAIRNAVWEGLKGTYYCGRVWDAWQVGTMDQSDFTPAEDLDEVIDPIVDGVVAALDSRAPAAQAASVAGWQPIATAPKDRVILLASGKISTAGRWQKGWGDAPDEMGIDDGWVDCEYNQFQPTRTFGPPAYQFSGCQPTHWMPLPPALQQEGSEAGK